MDIIQIYKNENGLVIKSNVSFDQDNQKAINDFFTQNGKMIILSKKDFEDWNTKIRLTFINCGIKKDKIHLLKALKLNSKKDINYPRRIIFNSQNIGAIKRSLNPLADQYHSSFPVSVIFIQDKIFEDLLKEVKLNSVSFLTATKNNSIDPMTDIVNRISKLPEVQKLSQEFVGNSPDMDFVRSFIYLAAQKESPVLILGESGTGKDVVANKIYELSQNQKYKTRFIRVNCSAFQDTLFESELFGHKKGSFTDATDDKVGLLKFANKATVFFDEIGDLSLANQAKLLHAVENKEFRPVGSNESLKVDFRIIAATNRRLDIMMKQERFRTDLYHRINAMHIYIPPIRSHSADIPLIAQTIWESEGNTQKLSTVFLDSLKEYYWPGNVRELKTLLRSINNYFGDISPTPEHIFAIQKQHNVGYDDSNSNSNDLNKELLWIEGRNRMVDVQNTLASIKIEIGKNFSAKKTSNSLVGDSREIKKFLVNKLEWLTVLCRQPIYFRKWNLSSQILQYRDLLDYLIINWPRNPEELKQYWLTQMETVDSKINQEIFNMIYGQVDL